MRLLLGIAALAIAATVAPARAETPWQFRLTPYAWLAGLKGQVATIPGQPAVPVDVSASQALKDLDGGGMLMLDARTGRHGVLADLLYTDVRSDDELLPPPIELHLNAVSKTTIASLAYQYELFRQDQTVVDVFAGLRYWRVDTELSFSGGLGVLAGRRIKNSESWIDPGVGVKARVPFGSSRFYFEGGAVLGGFGVGSDLLYELNGSVGYQWTKSIGTTIGYRMFDVDYEKDGFVYDVRQQGLQLGLTWSF